MFLPIGKGAVWSVQNLYNSDTRYKSPTRGIEGWCVIRAVAERRLSHRTFVFPVQE